MRPNIANVAAISVMVEIVASSSELAATQITAASKLPKPKPTKYFTNAMGGTLDAGS